MFEVHQVVWDSYGVKKTYAYGWDNSQEEGFENIANAREKVIENSLLSASSRLIDLRKDNLRAAIAGAKFGSVFYCEERFQEVCESFMEQMDENLCSFTIIRGSVPFKVAQEQWQVAGDFRDTETPGGVRNAEKSGEAQNTLDNRKARTLSLLKRIGNLGDFLNPSNFVIAALIFLWISFAVGGSVGLSAIAVISAIVAFGTLFWFGPYKLKQDFEKFRAFRDEILDKNPNVDGAKKQELKSAGNTLVAYLAVPFVRLWKWKSDHEGQAMIVGIGVFALVVALILTIGFFIGGPNGPFGFMESVFRPLVSWLTVDFYYTPPKPGDLTSPLPGHGINFAISGIWSDVLAGSIFVVTVMATTDFLRRVARLLYLVLTSTDPRDEGYHRVKDVESTKLGKMAPKDLEQGGQQNVEDLVLKTRLADTDKGSMLGSRENAPQDYQDAHFALDGKNNIVYRAVFAVASWQAKPSEGCGCRDFEQTLRRD